MTDDTKYLNVGSIPDVRSLGISHVNITLADGTEAEIPCSDIQAGWGDPTTAILAAAIHHLMKRVESLEAAKREAT